MVYNLQQLLISPVIMIHRSSINYIKNYLTETDLKYSESKLTGIECLEYAVKIGSLSLLQKTLSDKQIPYNLYIYNIAAKYGHFHILKWADENNVEFADDICDYCIENKRIDIISWLVNLGYRLSTMTTTLASKNNLLDMLIWLRKNGAPWDSTVILYSINNHNDKMFEWIMMNDYPKTPCTDILNGISPYEIAVEEQRLDILKYLYEEVQYNVKELSDKFLTLANIAAIHLNFNILNYLKTKNFTMVILLRFNDIEKNNILKNWAIQNRIAYAE